MGGDIHHSLDPAPNRDVTETRSQRTRIVLTLDRDDFRPEASDLLGQLIDPSPGGQPHHRESIGETLHDPKGVGPDGTGGAENGDALQRNESPTLRSVVRVGSGRLARKTSLKTIF